MTVALGDFFTRAAVPVVEALVKRSLTFLTAFLDTALWAKDAVDQAEQVLGGTRQLSIAAAGPTTVPPTTVPPTTVPPVSVEQVAQGFWDAVLARDRPAATQYGTADAYDVLRMRVEGVSGASSYRFRTCARLAPGDTHRGIFLSRGGALCGFGSPQDPLSFVSLLLVPTTDNGVFEVRGVAG